VLVGWCNQQQPQSLHHPAQQLEMSPLLLLMLMVVLVGQQQLLLQQRLNLAAAAVVVALQVTQLGSGALSEVARAAALRVALAACHSRWDAAVWER
jgi:hypothetical protein